MATAEHGAITFLEERLRVRQLAILQAWFSTHVLTERREDRESGPAPQKRPAGRSASSGGRPRNGRNVKSVLIAPALQCSIGFR